MRKSLFGGLVLLTGVALLVPTAAIADPEITWHAGLNTRLDYAANFTDGVDTDTGAVNKDDFEYIFYRANAGMQIDVDNITAYFDIQNHGTWGDSFISSNPQDPAIANLWATNLVNNNDMQLYQAWLSMNNIGGSMFSLKFGRMEKTIGNELHFGDADFYSGQYYDGIDLDLDFESWKLNLFWFLVSERDVLPGNLTSLDPTLLGGSDDTSVWGAVTDFTFGAEDNHTIEPYLFYKKQSDEANILFPRYHTYTLGLLYDGSAGILDWSGEYAMQTGESRGGCPGGASECDISAWVFEGEFGVTLGGNDDGTGHRFSVGALILSEGDDASDIETFMPLYTDTHRRAGAIDLFSLPLGVGVAGQFSNLSDINLGWDWTFSGGDASLGVAYHMFTLTEDFGAPDDDLGDEIDVIYNRNMGEHFGIQAGVGTFSVGDAVNPNGDDVMRAWLQGRFRL